MSLPVIGRGSAHVELEGVAEGVDGVVRTFLRDVRDGIVRVLQEIAGMSDALPDLMTMRGRPEHLLEDRREVGLTVIDEVGELLVAQSLPPMKGC